MEHDKFDSPNAETASVAWPTWSSVATNGPGAFKFGSGAGSLPSRLWSSKHLLTQMFMPIRRLFATIFVRYPG